jgi:hypothetical protein
MDRRAWIDVAAGSAVAVTGALIWHFPLRTAWGAALEHFGHTALTIVIGVAVILLFHITWIVLASWAATRGLRDPLDVWQRLLPVAVITTVATTLGIVADRVGFGERALPRDIVSEVAYWILSTGLHYTVLWIPAWILLRSLRREQAAEPPPIWRRPGVWIWIGLWAVGLLLEYAV